MVSNLVMLATTILHVGLQLSVFVPIDIDRRPVPGTYYARFMVYAGLLHFLRDMVLLPRRYQQRMGCVARFMVEVSLSAVVMEVLALVCWANIEIIICKVLKAALGYCGGAAKEYYQQNEAIVVGSVITSIAGAFWLSAARATDPWWCQKRKQQAAEQTTDGPSKELLQQLLEQEELQQQMDHEQLQQHRHRHTNSSSVSALN